MPRQALRTRRLLYTALVSFAASSSTSAQDSGSLDCNSAVTAADGVQYSLASLAGEHSIKRTRQTPPSTMEDELRFNVCQDLSRKENTPDGDQCPTGTRACLTKTNKKSGAEDRIIAVIPVAQTSTLQPAYSTLQSPAGLSVNLRGPDYPLSAPPNTPQSLNLTLICTTDGGSDPTFASYENGVASVEWKTSAGCPTKQSDDGNKGDSGGDGSGDGDKVDDGHSTGGSGIGWFFLLLFVSFVGYFALGAYYNYNNFGATGWDLVPHRDFWRDVPYLMRDFTEHLCSTLRPGRQGGSRRGYHAV